MRSEGKMSMNPAVKLGSMLEKLVSRRHRAYFIGNEALKNNDLRKAERKVSSAVGSEDVPAAWVQRLGFIQERSGNYHGALKTYYRAIAKDSTHAEWYYRAGVCAKAVDDSMRAVELFETAVRKRTGHERAASMLAASIPRDTPGWRKLELLELAHESSNSIDIARSTARINFHMHRYARVVEILGGSAVVNELNENDVVLLATSYSEQGQYEQAFSLLKKLWDRAGKNKRGDGPGGYLTKRGDWANAAAIHEHAWNSGQFKNSETAFQAGYAYDRQYNWSNALKWYERALQTPEGDSAYWTYKYAHAFERLHDYATSALWYKRALMLGGFKQADWFYRLGTVNYQLGEYREAYSALESWAELVSPNTDSKMSATADLASTDEDSTKSDYLDRIAAESEGLRDELMTRTSGLELLPEKLLAQARSARRTGNTAKAWLSYQQYLEHKFETSMEYVLEAASFGCSLGHAQKACEILLTRREFHRPDGIDMKKSIKSNYDRRRLRYAEYCDRFPIDERAILFESYWGTQVSDNPLGIYLSMVHDERFEDCRFYWVIQDNVTIPRSLLDDGRTILVSYGSMSYDRLLATAKIVINNTSFVEYYQRREGQRYLNTWHGTPMKTLGKRIQTGVFEHANVARNFLNVTDFALPNEHTARVLFEDYDIAGITHVSPKIVGSARLDTLLTTDGADSSGIKNVLNLPDSGECQIVLYAPTWRGSADNKGMDVELAEAVLHELGSLENTIVLFRAHHLAESAVAGLDGNFQVVPRSVDTYSLLKCVDVLVSDYSSIIFDFLATGRKTVAYVPDLDDYVEERGLYLNPYDLLDHVASTPEELLKMVADSVSVQGPRDRSTVEEYCKYEDGGASRRILDLLASPLPQPPTGERQSIVFFESMIPNGIRSSFENLCHLIDRDRFQLNVALDVKTLETDAKRQQGLSNLPKDVGVIGRIGEHLMTLEERYAIDQFSRRFGNVSEQIQALVNNAYRRELRRVFGGQPGVTYVDFEGYSRFWNSLFSRGVPGTQRSALILHNQMDLEMSRRFPYLAEIVRNYCHFDSIASVSDAITASNIRAIAEVGVEMDSRLRTVHNTIDADTILCRSAAGSSLWVARPAARNRIISIGRLSPEKNQALLIESMALVLKEVPDAQLMIVGTGPSGSTLQALIDDLNLGSSVYLAGYEPNPMTTLRESNLLALSSVHEGQPMVIFEAMVLGVPVLTTPVPGCIEACSYGDGHVSSWDVRQFAADIVDRLTARSAAREYDVNEYNSMALREFDAFIRYTG